MARSNHKHLSINFLVCSILILIAGCSSTYYGALESIGIPKRDVMVLRVEKARDSQQEAKEQFKSALEQFTTLTNFQGGDLEEAYNRLNNEYEDSVAKADKVHKHIADIEDVSGALFEEWQEELGQYSSPKLRQSSEQKLKATRKQYAQLINSMKSAEKQIDPVLIAFHDQVIYLKHNLNARAIAALQADLKSVEADIALLIKSMEKSINDADAFIKTMGVDS